jgi:hypothetical protein
MIRGLQPPASDADAPGDSNFAGPNAEEFRLPAQRVALSEDGGASLSFDVSLPAGYHVNAAAPSRYRAEVLSGDARLRFTGVGGFTTSWAEKHGTNLVELKSKGGLQLPVRLGLKTLAPGAAELRVSLTLYYCREDDTGVCRVKTLAWRAPVEVTADAGAPREITLRAKVE